MDFGAASAYAVKRARGHAKGANLSNMDMLINAYAVTVSATLVSPTMARSIISENGSSLKTGLQSKIRYGA